MILRVYDIRLSCMGHGNCPHHKVVAPNIEAAIRAVKTIDKFYADLIVTEIKDEGVVELVIMEG
jgi:hypothetical protein